MSSSTSSSSSSTSSCSSTSWSSRSTQSTSSSSHSSSSSVSSSSSSSSYIENWSSSSTSSSSYIENWSSSSSSYIENWSSTSSSSSYLDFHSNKTIPFIFEAEVVNPIWTMAAYKEDVYAGTGSDGLLLKSTNRSFWEKWYAVDDINITALLVVDDKLYIGTSPEGKIYILDLLTNVLTFCRQLHGKTVGFCYFQNVLYVATESNLYSYDVNRNSWNEFYKPYAKVNDILIFNSKMYVCLEAENIVYFDGTYWTMEKLGIDNVSSFRNNAKEPFSHVSNNLIDRSAIIETDGMATEDIYDIHPINYPYGINCADGDGAALVVGTSNYGKIYESFDSQLHLAFQTESENTVHAILNLSNGVNLAAIDNKLYLLYSGDLPSSVTTTTTTAISVTNATTTTIPTISVTSPVNGQNIQIGDTVTILWNSTKGVNDAVKIELMNGSTVASVINPQTSNNGSYDWTTDTSLAPSLSYKIRVTWLSTSSTQDPSNIGESGTFSLSYSVPTTTTTTTTSVNPNIPEVDKTHAIPILDLAYGEYITDIIKDEVKGGVLFSTSKGRILACNEYVFNAYLTAPDRKVYAEVRNGFGNISDTAWTNVFYGLYHKIAEINSDKEVTRWKYESQPSAIVSDRITGVFLSPMLYVKEDLVAWKQLIWNETKPANTEITICIRSADTIEKLQSLSWDSCFTSDGSTGLITKNIEEYHIAGKYLQFKVTMLTDKINVAPSILNLTISYSTAFALYFYTVKFSLDNGSAIKSGLITANITEPQNTKIQFGVCDENSNDWNDYTVVETGKMFSLNDFENVKVGIKMIAYDANVPEVAEFALLMGGEKDNLINE